MTRPDAPGYVRLSASVPLRADPEAVASMLRDGPSGWDERPAVSGFRRYAVDLRLRLGGDASGVTTFRKAAFVDIGPVRSAGDGGHVADISWRAATAAPLFPVFSGKLHVGSDTLTVRGLYAPPGGAAGILADRALLHIAANGTARWLLRELDRVALGAAA